MKLIAENLQDKKLLVKEARNKFGKNSLYIEGIFSQAGVKNFNQRIYPKEVLEAAVDKYNEDYIKQNRALGELEHPDTFNVNMERVCIMIESLTWDSNNLIGRARVLDDLPMGNVLRKLLDNKVKVGISSRGCGSISESNGDNIVQDDYILAAFDIVSAPSCNVAFVNGVNESCNYVYKNGIIQRDDSDNNDLLKAINRFNNPYRTL